MLGTCSYCVLVFALNIFVRMYMYIIPNLDSSLLVWYNESRTKVRVIMIHELCTVSNARLMECNIEG